MVPLGSNGGRPCGSTVVERCVCAVQPVPTIGWLKVTSARAGLAAAMLARTAVPTVIAMRSFKCFSHRVPRTLGALTDPRRRVHALAGRGLPRHAELA